MAIKPDGDLLPDLPGGKACDEAERGVYLRVNDECGDKRNASVGGQIRQQIYGFTPAEGSPCEETGGGEAVILYTLTAPSGAFVEVAGIGASLVSVNVPDRGGVLGDVVWEPAPVVVNRVWESRVEVNRVIFSITQPTPEGTLALEAAYHFSDEHELEIVYSAALDEDCGSGNEADYAGKVIPEQEPMQSDPQTDTEKTPTQTDIRPAVELQLPPPTRFDLSNDDRCFVIKDWQKNILAEAGTVACASTGRSLVVLTSLPSICVLGRGNDADDNANGKVCNNDDGKIGNKSNGENDTDGGDCNNLLPSQTLAPGEHIIHKVVYRFGIAKQVTGTK